MIKQHLAAVRMLCDFLVTGHVIEINPAHAVRGPKHVVTKGKTPILTADETRTLIESIDITKIAGLRDRAMIAVMLYSFARVGAVWLEEELNKLVLKEALVATHVEAQALQFIMRMAVLLKWRSR